MKILFCVPRYHPNHDGMVAGLLGAGHKVGFLVRKVQLKEGHRDGVPVTLLGDGDAAKAPTRRPRGFWQVLRIAYRHLRRTRPDLVIARNADRTSYAIFVACRLLGIRYLLYVQSRSGFESLGAGRRLRLRLGLWPRHTINSACAAPAAEVPGKTFDFAPFAVEVFGPAKTDYPDRPPIRVLAVAKLDQRRKNLVPLVRSVAPLLRAGAARLTIVGLVGRRPGDAYGELLGEIGAQGLGDRVTILENLDYARTRALYAENDLFVLASSDEPAAISPAEAMAAGIPVVCGSDNGTTYLIEPGETGFVFPDGDFAAMAERVGFFAENPAEVARMGRNGLRAAAGTWSPAAYARRLSDVVARRFG